MDANQFDRVVRAIGYRPSRRGVVSLLAGSAIGGHSAWHVLDLDAKKKKKRKKKKCRAPRIKCGKACCAVGQSCTDSQCSTPPPPPPPDATTTTTTATPPPGPNPACPGPFDITTSGARRFAQTFIAERTGLLAAAECQVTNVDAGDDFTLDIRTLDANGVPTGTILASDMVADVPAVPSGQTLTITGIFDPPASIESGKGYALAVTVGVGQTFGLRSRSGNACLGTRFVDFGATGTFVLLGDDMVFVASIVV